MRESQFIEKNKDKWMTFERQLNLETKDSDLLSELFIEITDDLSYARTFYKNRYIRVYLNNLCQQLFFHLYKSRKKTKTNSFVNFWTEELPFIAYQSRFELLVSLCVFLLAVAIGVVSSAFDSEFSKIILGDSYVAMTMENIDNGDPMAVYKKMNEVDMFLGITFNNVFVAFKTFILGIVFSIGSIIIMLYNGIMVGCFQYFFIEHGLFKESFLTIWLHGTLEISSIIIAGAAGIVLGKGFTSPRSYSRMQSFQISAKKGAKLLLGIVPILVFAAIIESFLTRYTDMNDIYRLILIGLSLAFMVYYFVYLPRQIAKKINIEFLKSEEVEASRNLDIDTQGVIKTAGEIIQDVFLFYRKYTNYILKLNLATTFVYLPLVMLILYTELQMESFDYSIWYLEKLDYFLSYLDRPLLYLIGTLTVTGYSYFLIRRIVEEVTSIKLQKSQVSRSIVLSLFVVMIMQLPFFITNGWAVVSFFAIVPFCLLWVFVIFRETKSIGASLNRVFELLKGNYGRFIGLYVIMLLIGFVCYLFLNSPFLVFYIKFISWNFPMSDEGISHLSILLNSFVTYFSFLVISPFYYLSIGILYDTLIEINEAHGLNEQISKFGK